MTEYEPGYEWDDESFDVHLHQYVTQTGSPDELHAILKYLIDEVQEPARKEYLNASIDRTLLQDGTDDDVWFHNEWRHAADLTEEELEEARNAGME